jgi:hypothetical protein
MIRPDFNNVCTPGHIGPRIAHRLRNSGRPVSYVRQRTDAAVGSRYASAMNNSTRSPRLPHAPHSLLPRSAGQALRHTAVVLSLLLWAATPAAAQVSIGVSMPGVSIGINMPVYPQLVRVPNYPVYYAPRLRTNFFFYDGMYWVYQQDNWYTSSWYNGPWWPVDAQAVPLYVLRIPVRYYRNPPTYFRGWQPDAPPRWGDHWGNQWAQRRSGWDHWDRRAAPGPAPLPLYQRQYSGNRYPRLEQQQPLQTRNYRYQPRDAVVRQHYQQQAAPPAGAPAQYMQHAAPAAAAPSLQGAQHAQPIRSSDQQSRPVVQSRPQMPPPQQWQQPQHQGAERHEPQAAGANDNGPPAGRAASPRPEQSPMQVQGQAQGRGGEKAKGQEHDRDNENDAGRQGRK